MYNKKYRLIEIDRSDENKNVRDDMEGSICYLAYFNVGERGWFLYEANDPPLFQYIEFILLWLKRFSAQGAIRLLL